jgi:colanic acid/amylovoran biosynthesis protein
MKIFVIHAHTSNRGDEAAVKAMIHEILASYSTAQIVISINGKDNFPNMPHNVEQIAHFPNVNSFIAKVFFIIAVFTGGRLVLGRQAMEFVKHLQEADLVIHAPGGPSIGDIYYDAEKLYLWRFSLIQNLGKPYVFYAPSMGPFESKKKNVKRRKALDGAARIMIRDPISLDYFKKFMPNKPVELAMDSALQHEIDREANEKKLKNYRELNGFLIGHEKCIGITITDLKWHPLYKDNPQIAHRIESVFRAFIGMCVENGYGIVFIPQLYGVLNDTELMNRFMFKNDCFMVDAATEAYDSDFQQYVISRLYAMIGMRYHSNIFSAKMGVPFISISYEQKMIGFMERMKLNDYCISLEQLTLELLKRKYEYLIGSYKQYKSTLGDMHEYMVKESYKSTQMVIDLLDELKIKRDRNQ